MAGASSKCLLVVLVVSIVAVQMPWASATDSSDYYKYKCPQVQWIVKQKVIEILKGNKNLAGGLLRLHFHDCFVRGCDGSALLDSPTGTGEKDAFVNLRLRGYKEIDKIKAAVEKACPGIVSCADVLALAARDAVELVGGPGWYVKLGRLDGFVTSAEEAEADLPSPFASFDELVQTFANVGLNRDDMVVLSGGHTIGRSFCDAVVPRLYNWTGVEGLVDPTLDPAFAEQLKKKCPRFEQGSILQMDPTKNQFDRLYFQVVLANKGLFHSDAQLKTNDRGLQLVKKFSQSDFVFSKAFGPAMQKMSNIPGVGAGEIRRKCRVPN